MNDCLNTSLEVYVPSLSKPWDLRRAQHLFNKMGIGASLPDIQWALSMTPEEAVDALIDASLQEPVPTKSDYPFGDPEHDPWQFSYDGEDDEGNSIRIWPNSLNSGPMVSHYFINAIENNSLRYKLLLFWTNHFVIEATNLAQYPSGFLYYYLTHIHTHAFGDFLEMTKAIGLTPAMLGYLNGNRSTAAAPNENYARELLELFTVGPDNYEQNDVEEIARIMTGWKAEFLPWADNANSGYPDNPGRWYPFTFNAHIFYPPHHDWEEKTVFNKSFKPDGETKEDAFQEYLWLHHEVIFKEKKDEIADFICRKLYKFFVYHEPNEAVIEQLANTFKNNDWNIESVLRQIFKSEHFFEADLIGAGIKSPFEFLFGFLRQGNLKIDEDYFKENSGEPHISFFQFQIPQMHHDCLSKLGQQLFSPVNVAGWPGGKSWLSENTMTKRWSVIYYKIEFYKNIMKPGSVFPFPERTFEKFRQMAKDLTQFATSSSDFNNVDAVVKAIAQHFIMVDLDESEMAAAVEVFKGDIPENYFNGEIWNLDYDEEFPYSSVPIQVLNLLLYLTKLPEYQLN